VDSVGSGLDPILVFFESPSPIKTDNSLGINVSRKTVYRVGSRICKNGLHATDATMCQSAGNMTPGMYVGCSQKQ
jgi:hypothetical protein